MPRQLISVNRGAGMTFAEIARVLGEKKSTVSMIYARAMRKLQANPEALQLLGLVNELEKERSRTW